jgi:hypothetical protein
VSFGKFIEIDETPFGDVNPEISELNFISESVDCFRIDSG